MSRNKSSRAAKAAESTTGSITEPGEFATGMCELGENFQRLVNGQSLAAFGETASMSVDRVLAQLAGAESLLDAGHRQDDVDWLSALSLVRLGQADLLPVRATLLGSIAECAAKTDVEIFGKLDLSRAEELLKPEPLYGVLPVDRERMDQDGVGARLSQASVSLAGARAVLDQVVELVGDQHVELLLRAALCTLGSVSREVDGIAAEMGGARPGAATSDAGACRVGG